MSKELHRAPAFWVFDVLFVLAAVSAYWARLYIQDVWIGIREQLLAGCGDAITYVTYVEVWEHWASGSPDNECLVLWGLPLLWWGRLGKLVAFVGSLLIVADIVDLKGFEQSLRDVGSSFKGAAIAAGGVGLAIILCVGLPVAAIAYIAIYGYSDYTKALSCGMEFTDCTPEQQWHYFWRTLLVIILSYGVPIGGVLLFVLIIGFAIPEFVLRPVASLLDVLPRWAKVLNLVLIVVAFHFDLLAS
jgi:hypothetical protein